MTFKRKMFAAPDDDVGITLSRFAEAIVTWAAMQNREYVTVAEAMAAFNTTRSAVVEAIGWTQGAFLVPAGRGDPAAAYIFLEGEN